MEMCDDAQTCARSSVARIHACASRCAVLYTACTSAPLCAFAKHSWMKVERQPFSPRCRGRVRNLRRASRRLFNFAPLRRRLAELTRTEVRPGREKFSFSSAANLESDLLSDPLIYKALKGRWSSARCRMDCYFFFPLISSGAVFRERCGICTDCKWSPSGRCQSFSFKIAVDKGLENGFWWGVEARGGRAPFVVDFLSFWTLPSQPPVVPHSRLSKLWSWALCARLPALNLQYDTRRSALWLSWNEQWRKWSLKEGGRVDEKDGAPVARQPSEGQPQVREERGTAGRRED